MFPFLVAVLLPLFCHMALMMWKAILFNQDARYIYPLLPCFVALYGRSLLLMRARKNALFEAIGVPRVRTELSVSYVDHNTLQSGFQNADDHRFLRLAAAKYGVYFSPYATRCTPFVSK